MTNYQKPIKKISIAASLLQLEVGESVAFRPTEVSPLSVKRMMYDIAKKNDRTYKLDYLHQPQVVVTRTK